MEPLQMSVSASPVATLLMLHRGPHEVLRAALPPPERMHPSACTTLLEALACWFQQPLSVALFVDVQAECSGLGLCNNYGVGADTLHYHVRVVEPGGHRGIRLGGVADFSGLRKMARRSWP